MAGEREAPVGDRVGETKKPLRGVLLPTGKTLPDGLSRAQAGFMGTPASLLLSLTP